DKRLLYVVAIVLMGSSLLLSGSRGGLVALFAELIFLALITSRSEGSSAVLRKTVLSLALIGGLVGGAMFVGGDTSLPRLADATAEGLITSSRTLIWSNTLHVIREHLPFGAGLEGGEE